MGAWIETARTRQYCQIALSPPVWGRGLKHSVKRVVNYLLKSPPVWGRGLKLVVVVEPSIVQ